MAEQISQILTPGTQVRVSQQIAARHYVWTAQVTGTVVKYSQEPTGSWFAHAKDGRLWLDRLQLRKSDGELTTLVLDRFTSIQILAQGH